MIRNLSASGSVKKMITLKSMRLEKLFPRSLHLSDEIGALRASNLCGPNGNLTLTARLRPYGNAGNWKKREQYNVCLCRNS